MPNRSAVNPASNPAVTPAGSGSRRIGCCRGTASAAPAVAPVLLPRPDDGES